MRARTLPELSGRGGRPRDPKLDGRVIAAAIRVLSETGKLHADHVASVARVGKASLYRRWPSLDALLVDVVLELGIRNVDHGEGPGDLVSDLARVLHAGVAGDAAAAERAVLPLIGRSVQLRTAYLAGPWTRLMAALAVVEHRSAARGEPSWSSVQPAIAGLRMMQHRAMVGSPDGLIEAAGIVERIVLPALAVAS